MRSFLIMLWLVLLAASEGRAQSRTYTFATYTYDTNNRLQNLVPLAKYISEKTGLPVTAISYPTVEELIRAIADDKVDFAMMNTSGYLVLTKNHPNSASPLVNLYMGQDSITNYSGCIIAGKHLGIETLNELPTAGLKLDLSLVKASSTSGNLLPRLLLNSKGIANADSAFNVNYAGTHLGVVEKVLSGEAGLGGCGCAEVDSARLHLDFDAKAVVLASFHDIPLGPVVVSRKVSDEVSARISKLLLEVHSLNPVVFQNFCMGWTEFKGAKRFKGVGDSEYDKFRLMFGDNVSLWRMIR